jgi:hypothetical protein
MRIETKSQEVTVLPDGRMNTHNAAIYAGFSEKTMAMMRCEGKGPEYIKIGRIFYFQEKLDEWIKSFVTKTHCVANEITSGRGEQS